MYICCFSHTIDHVGSHFETPTLNDFITLWICLFPRPDCPGGQGQAGACPAIAAQVVEQMGGCNALYRRHRAFPSGKWVLGPNLHSKLLAFFDTPHITSKLRVEIAATIDWGESFVKACYILEGDGPLCFEVIDKVKAGFAIHPMCVVLQTYLLDNYLSTLTMNSG